MVSRYRLRPLGNYPGTARYAEDLEPDAARLRLLPLDLRNIRRAKWCHLVGPFLCHFHHWALLPRVSGRRGVWLIGPAVLANAAPAVGQPARVDAVSRGQLLAQQSTFSGNHVRHLLGYGLSADF